MSDTSAALLTAVVTATPEIAALVGSAGEVLWLNQAFVTRWPCADHPDVEGLLDVVDPDDHASVASAWDLVSSGELRTTIRRVRLGCAHARRPGRIRLTRVDGGARDGSIVVHVEEVDGISPAVGVDPLTGLANRQALMAQMDAALAGRGCVGLLLVDLDGFQVVNSTLGHLAGDDALVAIARRLRYTTHPNDVVARVGDDEFAILLCETGESVDAVATRLRQEIARPIETGAAPLTLDCSIGVALPEVMTGTIEALGAAESAVFLAKSRGGGRVEVYDAGLRDASLRSLRRASELRQAAANGELTLQYQPIVDLTTGVTLGCEGLLRWLHPTDGEIAAGEFIEAAESSGLVTELTESLLVEACVAASRLARASGDAEPPYIAVNLSPRQLSDARLVEQVDAALKRAGIAARQLMLEITETGVVTDVAGAVATLTALRERGVRIALDDFGTGFSSLLRLRDLPVDCLKIDRAFVNGVVRSPDDLAIVASVISMASTLQVACVAEGVETQEQAEQLRRLGCTAGQGFLWSRAVPIAAVPLEPGRVSQGRRDRKRRPSVDPVVAARILQLHRSGASLNSIAAVLNQDGCRTERGTRWHARSVADVVSRAAYPDLER